MVADNNNTNNENESKLQDAFADALGVSPKELEGVFKKKEEPSCPAPRTESFDESAYYEKEIWPRMQELARLCKAKGLPHLIWVINACETGEDGKGGNSSNGLISSTNHTCAKKMALLANVADGTLSFDLLAKMAFVSMLENGFGGNSHND